MQPDALKSLLILVVEDDALLGIVLAETLKELGFAVCPVAATEADAVIFAALYRPGLMIVDVRLGKGNGIAAVQQVLAAGIVPHIFMSGDISQVLAIRPDAVTLRKPFKDTELRRAIQLALHIDTFPEVASP